MIKKYFAVLLAVLMLAALVAGCAAPAESSAPDAVEPETAPAAEAEAEEPEAPAEPVVLTVAGGWPDCRALDLVATAFTAKYPNCTVQYEYLQDYYASLQKRMTGEAAVDIFFTSNIQADSEMLPYAQELFSCEGLDLSSTFDGLIDNFVYFGDGTSAEKEIYSIPLGAEMRGLYVNKTLLDSLGIAMPTDQASLLAACKTLTANGYIPFHGNPGSFSQTLLYPWVCNIVANADDPQAAYDRVNTREPGMSEMFREPFAFMYTLLENGYYDYKRAQTDLNLFVETTDLAYAQDFFNIRLNGDVLEKADDLGQVAFLPSPMSLQNTMEKVKDDYHSDIEYAFVLAPVGPDGGYAYMSPAHGIAINKDSAQLDWSVRFLDFLFTPEMNRVFAEAFGIVPNTEEAYDYIHSLFDMPDDHISQLGQVTYSYGFYGIVTDALLTVSKGNNPKYMQDDGSGNLSLYPLDYYMDAFEASLQQP